MCKNVDIQTHNITSKLKSVCFARYDVKFKVVNVLNYIIMMLLMISMARLVI